MIGPAATQQSSEAAKVIFSWNPDSPLNNGVTRPITAPPHRAVARIIEEEAALEDFKENASSGSGTTKGSSAMSSIDLASISAASYRTDDSSGSSQVPQLHEMETALQEMDNARFSQSPAQVTESLEQSSSTTLAESETNSPAEDHQEQLSTPRPVKAIMPADFMGANAPTGFSSADAIAETALPEPAVGFTFRRAGKASRRAEYEQAVAVEDMKRGGSDWTGGGTGRIRAPAPSKHSTVWEDAAGTKTVERTVVRRLRRNTPNSGKLFETNPVLLGDYSGPEERTRLNRSYSGALAVNNSNAVSNTLRGVLREEDEVVDEIRQVMGVSGRIRPMTAGARLESTEAAYGDWLESWRETQANLFGFGPRKAVRTRSRCSDTRRVTLIRTFVNEEEDETAVMRRRDEDAAIQARRIAEATASYDVAAAASVARSRAQRERFASHACFSDPLYDTKPTPELNITIDDM